MNRLKKKWRRFFWSKRWYQARILGGLRLFLGKSWLTENGWIKYEDSYRDTCNKNIS